MPARYRCSVRRTESDGRKLRDEQASIYVDAFAALAAEVGPSDERAMDLAECRRLSIDRWCYPCSAVVHCGLAALYEADERFAASIDKHGAGLAKNLVAAVRANAARCAAPF